MANKRRKHVAQNDELAVGLMNDISKNSGLLNYEMKKLFEFNENHTKLLHLLQTNKTKMVFVDGCAGSGKTFLAVYAGLHLLKEHYIDNIIYIRTVVESASKQIGFLPGEVNDKFLPWTMPLLEKITEITDKTFADNLYKKDIIKGMPVNFCRGLTFNNALVIVDEFQNLQFAEAVNILTRFGNKSKYVLIGDSKQSDIGNKSCMKKVQDCFNNEESRLNNIHCLKFNENDVVRSEILKFIVKQLDAV